MIQAVAQGSTLAETRPRASRNAGPAAPPPAAADSFAASPLAACLWPKHGTHLFAGFTMGNDPSGRQEVLEEVAALQKLHGSKWDKVGSTGGSGGQVACVRDLLRVTRGDQELDLSAETSLVFTRTTADHRMIDGVWGPAANRFLARAGGDLAYVKHLDQGWQVRADALYGVNLALLRSDANDGVTCLPHQPAPYIGGRLGVSSPRLGAFMQIDEDMTGPARGQVRGTVGVTYNVAAKAQRGRVPA